MTLVLTRNHVRDLLDYPSCIAIVEQAFQKQSASIPAAVTGTHVPHGGFHVKTAGLDGFYAAKINANFPGNPAAHGLPTIQGVIALYDVDNGSLLALLDSIEITTLRTAAASAVAAKYLAKSNAETLTLMGHGNQGRAHLAAFQHVCAVRKIFTFDVGEDYHDAVRISDIVITCTPSRTPLLDVDDIDLERNTFIAAVGTDNEDKSEVAPALMAASHVVVDVLEQCARIGDLHHALAANLMTREQVYADLSEIVCGKAKPDDGRPVIFDSTGTALTDVACAAAVYQTAMRKGLGLAIDLSQ